MTTHAPIDEEAAYRACSGREARFDGRLFLAVTSTGIYCRPSCPARTPKRANCRFFASAAACVAAGFRACRRCRPDALPGLRDAAGDSLATQALRHLREGDADERGVAGLASRLGVSERHLRRVVFEATGATPLQLAAARRTSLARQLIEQTSLPLADVAFAAGFRSLRRFNEAMLAAFGGAPSTFSRPSHPHSDSAPAATSADGLDAAGERAASTERPRLTLRLRVRAPFHAAALRAFLTNHAVAGLERPSDAALTRVIPVPGGLALARIDWPTNPPEATDTVVTHLELPRLDALPAAISAVRRLLDLDADPGLVDAALAADTRLAPLVAERPGIRLPGSVSPGETAMMVVLGQQVSVKAARTVQARLVSALCAPAPELGEGWRTPPSPGAIAAVGPARLRELLGIDGNRAAALTNLAAALDGGLDLGPGAAPDATRAALLALPRIGPWTADLIALRCLGDPDVFASGDLVARRALASLAGVDRLTPRAADAVAESWRPWRSYALLHLWTTEYHA